MGEPFQRWHANINSTVLFGQKAEANAAVELFSPHLWRACWLGATSSEKLGQSCMGIAPLVAEKVKENSRTGTAVNLFTDFSFMLAVVVLES